MWYGIGFGALLYFLLAFTLGLMTLEKRTQMVPPFFFGIFLPFLWIVGALMRPPGGSGYATADEGPNSATAARDEATRIRTGLQ